MSAAQDSLFSADTLDGLRAAMVDARRAGDPALIRCVEAVSAAVAASDAGRTDHARHLLTEALVASTDVRLLYVAYQFHFRSGEYDHAERYIRRRLSAAEAESPEAARAWNNLGLLCFMQGDHAAAEAHLRRALDMDTRLGHEPGIARDLGSLSLIPEARGNLDEAERLNRESLTVAERIGYTAVIASRLCNLGEIAMARGRIDEARDHLSRAEALFRSLGIEKHRRLCESHLQSLKSRA